MGNLYYNKRIPSLIFFCSEARGRSFSYGYALCCDIEKSVMKNQISLIVVEDDLDEQQLLKEALEASGHFSVIYMASHRNELMKQLGSNIPDAILCAYHLPAQNGVEILKELKASDTYAAISFVLVDNGYDESYKSEASKLDPAGFLARPVSIDGYQNFENNLYEILKPLKEDVPIDEIKG